MAGRPQPATAARARRFGRARGAGHLLGLRCLAHEAENLPASAAGSSRRGAPRTGLRRPWPPRGDAHASTNRRPAAPWPRPRRDGRAGADRLGEGLGVVGPHRQAGPGPLDGPGHLGAGVDAGHDRATGGQDRVQLRRHARAGQAPLAAAPRGCRPAASTSGRRSLGCMSTKRTLSSPGPRRSRSARAAPPPLMTKTTSGSWRRAVAAAEHQVERLGQPDVAGVHHDPLAGRGRTRRGSALSRGPGWIQSVSTKLGITRTLAAARSAAGPLRPRVSLARTLSAQVVGQHGDRVGAAVGRALEPATPRR